MIFKNIVRDLKQMALASLRKFINMVRDKNGRIDIRIGDKVVDIYSDNDIDDILDRLEYNNEEVELDIPTPEGVDDFEIYEEDYLFDVESMDKVSSFIADMQGSDITEEPTDQEMDSFYEEQITTPYQSEYEPRYSSNRYKENKDLQTNFPLNREPLPENYEKQYFPSISNKKPNIDKIKYWVEETKVDTKSETELIEEYVKLTNKKGAYPSVLTDSMREYLIDAFTYCVARKIWYVGRKPSHISDYEWNEMTKHERPPEGSFGSNDKFINMDFPYDSSYVYKSGEFR